MQYAFTLTGLTPLLMHADHVLAADELVAWRKSPRNKSISVPGDDRSPPWTWLTYLHHDDEHVVVPHEYLMTALRSAGAKISAKGKSTFKSLSQSGIVMTADSFPLLVGNGKPIPLASITPFRDEESFTTHLHGVRDLGFRLDVRRAKVGTSKHVRVRPCFREWSVSGTLLVTEPAITHDVLTQMLEIAGSKVGIGDWRPSAPQSPGNHGMFTARIDRCK